MSKRILLLAFLMAAASRAIAQTSAVAADPPRRLDKAEEELVRICQEMQSDYDKYYGRAEEIKNETERDKFLNENDPAPKYVARFSEFERSHHGMHAGLMAARQLVLAAGGGGEPRNVRELGRRHILGVLHDYARAPELPEIIRYLDTGTAEPLCETFLRALAVAENATEQNRAFARYMFARWCLAMGNNRQWLESRLGELEGGAQPQYSGEKLALAKSLTGALPPEKIAALKTEALNTLESLCRCDPDLKQPGIVGVDKDWSIIEFSPEKTETMPAIKDLAAGLLFKEQHLSLGSEAPDLKLEIVGGKTWSLGEQAGKVVIIQFSFKGCGPCEAMYADLRSLVEEYGEKLNVLSIMADENREDTTEAVESAKLTWNVYWDGFRGPIATMWAVKSFPTVYIVGPDGRIAAHNLRSDRLRAKIAELVRMIGG